MTRLAWVFLAAFATTASCSRRPAPAPPVRPSARAAEPAAPGPRLVAARSEAQAEERAREREEGENPAREVMERQREISPYAPDEAGLARMFRDVVAAAAAGDRARLEELVAPMSPSRERLRLVLTFDGDRVLAPYLTGPNAPTRDALVARALAWGALADVSVTAATGEQVAQRAPAAQGLDPGMARVAAYLRPLVRFYRVTLAHPARTAPPVVLETVVYAGGRWLLVERPWRFAPGSAERDAVAPAPAWADELRAAPR